MTTAHPYVAAGALLSVLVLALGTAACPNQPGDSCESNADCFEDEVCTDGTCSKKTGGSDTGATSDTSEPLDTGRESDSNSTMDAHGDPDTRSAGDTEDSSDTSSPDSGCTQSGKEVDDGVDNDCDGLEDNVPYTTLLGRQTDEFVDNGQSISVDSDSGKVYVVYEQNITGNPGRIFMHVLDRKGGESKPFKVGDGLAKGGIRFANDSIFIAHTEIAMPTHGLVTTYAKGNTKEWETNEILTSSPSFDGRDLAVESGPQTVYLVGRGRDGADHKPWLFSFDSTKSCTSGSNKACVNWRRGFPTGSYRGASLEGVEVDPTDRTVYVAGTIDSSVGSQPQPDAAAAMLAKYDSGGNRKWVRTIDGPKNQQGRDIAVDPKRGLIYIAGRTKGSVEGHTHTGGWDAFVAAYDRSGKRQWLDARGSANEEMYESVDARKRDGAVVVTGQTDGRFDSKSPVGKSDAIVARYGQQGKLRDSTLLGTGEADEGKGIEVDQERNDVYVIGTTAGNLECSSCSHGKRDVFVKRMKMP